MTEWWWVGEELAHTIHTEQIDEHGGIHGLRGGAAGGLSSALARPLNLCAYGSEEPDAADLAACYIAGVQHAQAFLEGNKRTAWVVGYTFLLSNGYLLSGCCVEVVKNLMDAVAKHEFSQEELADWLRDRMFPVSP